MGDLPARGWYADPDDPYGERWWDGQGWGGSRRRPDGNATPPPPTSSKRPDSKARTILSILAAVAVIGGVIWWLSQPDTDDIAEQVKSSMQSTLRADHALAQYSLTVDSVSLIESSGNQYDGLATIHTARGSTDKISVQVTADGDDVIWRIPPGAFLNLVRQEAAG